MLLEGQHLGHYRLLRLLGSGGMGEVYLAEDARIGQQVAIKVIRAEGIAYPQSESAKEAARLFEREARAIARLDHPNILPLYAYGEETLGEQLLTYLVMPYRKEGTLANWLRRRSSTVPLSPAEVTPLLQQAAAALQHAHDQHVLHQDIKPSNLLIRERSDQPEHPDLLLSDFGIAKLTSATGSVSQSIRGTPTYMAPEQWDGHPVAASDQYALAIMVYELLAGRPPFMGNPGQVMRQHYLAAPPPPGSPGGSLSPAIDAVLLRALSKQPEERFPSVTAFARAFQEAWQSEGALHATLAISRAEAESGTTRTLTLPGGRQVRVAVSAGVGDGSILRLEGQGMPYYAGGPAGPLVLTIAISAEASPLPLVPESTEPTVAVSMPQAGLPAVEKPSVPSARPEAPGDLEPTVPASNASESASTVLTTDATSLPTLSPPSPSPPASVRVARWCALAGVVGPIFFLAVFTLAGFLRPGYSPVRQPVSDLGVGPSGWIVDGPAVLTGLLLLAFALGFASLMGATLSPGKRWLCAALLALHGLGYLIASLFTEAPATQTIHLWLGATLLFFGPVVAFFVLGLVLRDQAGWQRWSRYSVLASLATLGLSLFTFVSFPGFPNAAAQISGLLERLLFLEISAWYIACGWRLWIGRGSSQEAGKALASLWIALEILAVVLVAGGVASFVANQGTPIQAAQARCADVSNGDWRDFYTYSTPGLQGQFGPEDQFVATQQQYVSSHSGVMSCTITTLNQNGSTATGTVVVTYSDGSQDTFDFQEVLENGGWEISQDVRRGG